MAYNYAQLSLGAKNDRETVRKVQRLLNEKLRAGLQEDGIYGPKTYSAVKRYQGANGLQVDGIVGTKTWASLLGSANQQTGATASHGSHSLAGAMGSAQERYEPQTKEDPEPETETGGSSTTESKKEFSYEPSTDPLYLQYRDRYTDAGRLAMEDTIGRAAALTGGYGNSYAQSAGQQAYQSYMQQLTDMLPELYALAYDVYQQREDAEQTRYQQQLDYLQDSLDRQADQEKERLSQKQIAYKNLCQLVQSGYNPTNQELAAVGMTRAQANALRKK